MSAVEPEQFPAWTAGKSPALGGRDFLGLQSVGDAMLDRLLPGMTNQTRHPRYYAFFVWVFDQAQKAGVKLQRIDELRFRFESALIYAAASRHEGDFRGIVGILGVTRGNHAWRGRQHEYPLGQEAWPRRASAFSAPFYSPSFQQLGLVQRGEHGAIGLLPRGRELAIAFDAGYENSGIARTLRDVNKKRIAGSSLAKLHDDLCPCVVREPERALLREMLFRTDRDHGKGAGANERNRRLTLAYVLDLVNQSDGDYPTDDEGLRTLLYYWRYPQGRPYNPQKALLDLAITWRLFQARQYQRYAIESLWVAYLRMLQVRRSVPFDPASMAAEIVKSLKDLELFKEAGVPAREVDRLSIAEMATRLARSKGFGKDGRATEWWKTASPSATAAEASWKSRIDKYLWEDRDDVAVFGSAVGLLLMLWIRWRDASEPELGKGFMRAGGRPRVSLSTMFSEFGRQQESRLKEFCSWLLGEYAIGQHLRVASHKLRTEGIDTFWFYAEEDGYSVHPERQVERASPGYNAPKLRAATSSLYDLGLLRRTRDAAYACTKDGQRMLNTVLQMESQGSGAEAP